MIKDLFYVRDALNRGDFENAVKIAEKIKDSYWRSYAFKWIAQEIVKINSERARKIASQILISSLRNDTLLYLSYELANEEKFKEAIETAKLIEDKYSRKKALRKITNALANTLKKKNVTEVKLGELSLSEEDVELLKPLPPGIKYENGKFLIDAEIVKGVGELRNEVVEVTETKLEVKDVRESLQEDFLDLTNLSEPFKSAFLEKLGLEYLENGNLEEAESIMKKIKRGGTLPRLLFFLGRNDDVKTVVRPIDKVLLAYRIAVTYSNEEALKLILEIFRQEEKLKDVLRFLSFELLEEGKRRNNKRILELSRKLFEISAKVQASQ
ncbi:hypothetical protein PFDSM3638_01545 [Pyrococcus furiosus DSM 3638]|uniref:Uncharacterized protein n=3 Tax=Pyrococcus furiosus TaxID=2261 RepID=A0A5C0XM09_PYRFU|nr:hypothetical protein [Pyrococcus furiosus]AAL80444.1 hypothetical protein PF0320 [Pyrococcus furiosus DSM 3638]AFN03109.1 hypothetical protein PFC_00675 [Pyrococcus furiosus COM1]QEK78036.1 hypothetical protein PFDSM3638_01545 [Pyrococcus furiosus DSM 3638]